MIVFMLMTLPITGSEDILELASTGDGIGYPASITRRKGDGSSLWTVLPPEGSRQDAWVAVRIDGPRVIASSWSGYLVHLDLDTGGEIVRAFTK
jgi:hypothetical protein